MDNKSFRYNIEGLAADMEIDLAELTSLYSEYFIEMRINIQESKALRANNDWVKLERIIHNMKGISTSLNVDDVYLMAAKLDNKLRSANYENIENDINFIVELYNRAENDIMEFFKEKDMKI
ncbi:MAG: Hpt domain-containing protein [Bacillota bacterium]|nr:Hpt domain-containing protein [Bacillota bacterium]